MSSRLFPIYQINCLCDKYSCSSTSHWYSNGLLVSLAMRWGYIQSALRLIHWDVVGVHLSAYRLIHWDVLGVHLDIYPFGDKSLVLATNLIFLETSLVIFYFLLGCAWVHLECISLDLFFKLIFTLSFWRNFFCLTPPRDPCIPNPTNNTTMLHARFNKIVLVHDSHIKTV